MSRLLPRSLQARMLLVSAAATMLALVLAGAVMAGLLGRFVTEGLDRRLDAQLLVLASVVDGEGRVDRTRLTQRAAAFGSDPGWQWQIKGPDGAIGAADIPAPPAGPPTPPAPPAPPAPPGPHPVEAKAADGGTLHARTITLTTRRGDVTLTAAAPRDVIARPIEGALTPLLMALAGVAALLTGALLVQLRIALRPLRRLREQVAAIRIGAREQVDEDQPAELAPLASELNALTVDNAAALATARASAANLAHALKTPVAALAIDLRDQPRLAATVARIDRTIRHHLARARAAAVNRRVATPLAHAVADIAVVVERLHDGPPLTIVREITDDIAVAVDAQDLDELLGNLLDNAARHAASRIVVAAHRDGRSVAVTIADDGSGIPATARAQVLQPGTRLDERGDGHGFGLPIVAELAALYGGSVTLAENAPHGLLVTLTLPAA
ncbi:sensor histidine kinase [Sphingomonas phyllosphaerae]|uniref:sensor histidine kinase n=1 Tax=Sphingomonas phyllosphaerae TaxID=257003 RepID=UPI00055B5640|nr:HAMP domain-containing sensor histidine kinase [Sphingomonas phyllosphaerae]